MGTLVPLIRSEIREAIVKLATYRVGVEGSERVGVVVGDRIYDAMACMREKRAQVGSGRGDPVSWSDLVGLLGAGPEAMAEVEATIEWAEGQPGVEGVVHKLADVALGPPLPCPGKLFCLAGNYADHILEGGGSYPGKEAMIPRFFLKPCTAVVGPGDPIRIPPSSAWTDWEVELAVVIGRRGRDLTPDIAGEHIAGYTILNDVSARELALRSDKPQREGDAFFDWLVGKWLDTFAPMGPWVTTADEIDDPNRLRIKLWVNDELHQEGVTGQMIFQPEEAIAFISQFVTLEPGDLIATGTPGGVGHSKGIGLKPGDRVRCEIDGLGVLENPVEAI